MYMLKIEAGGMDWHDHGTVLEQMISHGSYDIPRDRIPEVIADDMVKRYPYHEDIRERVLGAIRNEESITFPIYTEGRDDEGNVTWTPCARYEDENQEYENKATFDASNHRAYTITEYYCFGQFAYDVTYTVDEIPKNNLCFTVEEHFRNPIDKVSAVARLWHDPFGSAKEAEDYAKELRGLLEGRKKQPECMCYVGVFAHNKTEIQNTDWYKNQMKILRLMAAKNQTPISPSFRTFAENHIKELEAM